MATSCPIVESKEWQDLLGSVTETSARRLFNNHDGKIPTPIVGRNEIFEEYGCLYGGVELQKYLSRPDSFFEYSNYLKKLGVNIIIGDKINQFKVDYGYDAYNPLSNGTVGVYVSKDDILNYNQVNDTDYGFAVEYAKSQGKKVLSYRTQNDGDIVVLLDKNLKTVDLTSKQLIEDFEFYNSIMPSSLEQARIKTFDKLYDDLVQNNVVVDNKDAIVLDTFAQLANELGVKYKIVSVDDAIEITKLAKDKFTKDSKEPGFFYKGNIYLINGRVNEKTALHEMSHFVVRAIRLQNKELFDNMFKEAIQTEEGRKIYDDIKTKSEADSTAEELKEEVLATLLKINPNKASKRFETHNNNIWYYIKQFFRKLFGGNKMNKISNLNRNTTLYELADMIQEGGIKTISSRGMELSDIVLYDGTKVNESEFKFSPKEVAFFNETFSNMSKSLKSLISKIPHSKIYEYISESGLLEDLQKRIINKVPSKDMITKEMYNTLNHSVDNTEARLRNFINVVNGFAVTLINMNDALVQFNALDDRESVQLFWVCEEIISTWEHYFNPDLYSGIIENEEVKNIIITRINNVQNLIRSNKNRIKDRKVECVVNVLSDQVGVLQRNAAQKGSRFYKLLNPEENAKLDSRTRINEEITYYGMSKKSYERFLELYDKYDSKDGIQNQSEFREFVDLCNNLSNGAIVSKQKLRLMLDGMMEDMGVFTEWMDEFIRSQDLLVSSLQKFLKDNYTNQLNKSVDFATEMQNKILPLMKKAGFSRSEERKMMEKLCRLDDVFVRDDQASIDKEKDFIKQLKNEGITEEKNLTEYQKRLEEFRQKNTSKVVSKVWTLKNEFKNYRAVIDKLTDDVNIYSSLYQNEPNDENYDKYLNAVDLKRRFERVFMCKEYSEEFYSIDDIMNDNIGREALDRRTTILSQISEKQRQRTYSEDDEALEKEINDLWRQYSFLTSTFNEDGSEKTGKELQIAERLKEYNKLKKQFFDKVINIDSFKEAYERKEQELIKEYGKDTPKFHALMQAWIDENTVEEGSDYYKSEYERLQNEINELRGSNKLLQEKWEQLLELTKPYRTQNAGIEYHQMPKEVFDKANSLMDEIENMHGTDFSNVKVDGHPITAEEIQRYNDIEEIFLETGFITDADDKFYSNIFDQLDEGNGQLLKDKYIQLRALRQSKPSKDYLSDLNGLLKKSGYNVYLHGGFDFDSEGNITALGAEMLLQNTNVLDEIRKDNDINDWFKRCHTVKIYGDKKYVKRKYLYNENSIADNDMLLKKTEFYIGTRKITLNRVPNNSYVHYEVKKEYITERIEGKTVDVWGRWMPKDYEAMENTDASIFDANGFSVSDRHQFHDEEYIALKKQGGPVYELLEELKRMHLSAQKDADYGCRLGYDIPRYRMDNYDVVTSSNVKKSLWMKIRDSWGMGVTSLNADHLNYNESFNMVQVGMIDAIVQPKAPVHGLFNISSDYVSHNILDSIAKYNMELRRADALRESYGVMSYVRGMVNEQKTPSKKDDDKIIRDSSGRLSKNNKKSGDNTDYGTRRARVINTLWDADFEGKYIASLNGQSVGAIVFDKIFSKINKFASFSFFAFDWYSSTKNYTGQKFQQLIESFGKQGFSPTTLAKADVLAVRAMYQAAATYKANDHIPLLLQLGRAYDFIQGRTVDRMGKELGNSYVRAFMDFTFPTAMRKHGEFQATYQLGYAKLLGQTIKNKKTGSLVNATEIYELDSDGNIALKDGIDARYNIKEIYHVISDEDTYESILQKYYIDDTDENRKAVFGKIDINQLKSFAEGIRYTHKEHIDNIEYNFSKGYINETERDLEIQKENDAYQKKIQRGCSIRIDNSLFHDLKNDIQGTFNVCNGAYNNADANLISRTLIGKQFMALKKYFMPMFTNKYLPRSMNFRRVDGKLRFVVTPRLDVSRQTIKDPTYISALRSIGRMLLLKNPFICEDDKRNLIKASMEWIIVGWLSKLFIYALLGIDDDDEDLTPEEFRQLKSEKFKSLSGAATWWDIPEDFNFAGWLKQRAVVNLMLFQQEQRQFSTRPTQMIPDFFMPNIVTFSPTIGNYTKILDNSWDMLLNTMGIQTEGRLYYSRDVGPYPWQKQDSAKIWTYIMKMWGVTGNNLDNFVRYNQVEQSLFGGSYKIG